MMKTFLLLVAALLCAVQGFVVQPGKMNKVSVAPKTSLKTPSSIIATPKKQEDSSTSLHYGLARYGGYGGYGRGYGGYGLSRYGGYGGYYDDDYYYGYGGYGRGYGGYGGYGRGYGRMGYGRGYGGYGGYWDDYDDWGYGGYYGGYRDPT